MPKKNKVMSNNHPFLKFIGKKTHKEKADSPYSKPLHYRNISIQSNSGHSVPTQKPIKTSIPKKPLFLSKDQISLRG